MRWAPAIPLLIALQIGGHLSQPARPRASPYYLTLFAVIADPQQLQPAAEFARRACGRPRSACWLLAALARVPHAAATPLSIGGMLPICFCAVMTLLSALQRNREARRAYLLDLRHRLRVAEAGQEARHDPLTGLANRRRLEEVAAKLWTEETSHVSPISVVLYDVDRFKAFNDLYGHQAGDDCLRRVAACALEEIGAEDDVAARYGGEEFILLLPRTPLDEARRVAERLRAAVAALRIPHAGRRGAGRRHRQLRRRQRRDVATARSPNLTAEADAALYRAKRGGRNRVLRPRRADRRPPERLPKRRLRRHAAGRRGIMARLRFEPEIFTTCWGRSPRLRASPTATRSSRETVDAWGFDKTRLRRHTPPNPMTGPFYVEGAEPGDALGVRIERMTANRDEGWTFGPVAPNVVDPAAAARLARSASACSGGSTARRASRG